MGLTDGVRVPPSDEVMLKTYEVLIYSALLDHYGHMRRDDYFPSTCTFCRDELRQALIDHVSVIRRGR
jgi:hypothetical protein